MNPLSNILIKSNVITQKGIDFFVDYIKSQKQSDLEIFDAKTSNVQNKNIKNPTWKTDKSVRDTQTVSIDSILPQTHDLFKNVVTNIINPFYNIEIHDSEIPQLLVYNVGGHYNPHIDGESPWTNPDKSVIWRKIADRDLSVILYLNDDFEGGDLIFPDLHIHIKPKPGLLVTFPSTHLYRHGVTPISKGKRYAIITWMTIKGFPTVKDQEEEFSKKFNIS
jgi:predicted 2-oxoglutarate/Fe(II)-dependent dioxygenase YbiX